MNPVAQALLEQLGASAVFMVVIGYFLSRVIKKFEANAEIRDKSLDLVVQHFHDKSAVAAEVGTLPDRVRDIQATVKEVEERLNAEVLSRVKQAQTDIVSIRERVQALETRIQGHHEAVLRFENDIASIRRLQKEAE